MVTILVGLYTSRVVIAALGVSDYGLYNVIGGLVVMFTFVCTALAGGTQRFLNIALGKGGASYLNKTFAVCFTLHACIALLLFVVVSSIGPYLVETQLQIEAGREKAAYFVLYFSAFSVSLDVVKVPFYSAVIAHEKMNFYAIICIVESLARLSVALILRCTSSCDLLILYAGLYTSTTFAILCFYILYCSKNFSECRISFSFDSVLVKEIGTYTTWNLLGNLSYMVSTSGVNVLLNIFHGTLINAARGISVQVGSAVQQFSTNFIIAASPQIVKRYAAGEIGNMFLLAKNVSKYAAFLLFLVLTPIILETKYLLQLWLTEVPLHTVFFSRVLFVQVFISTITMPFLDIIGATGRNKVPSTCILIIQFFYFLLTWLLLKLSIDVDFVYMLYVLPAGIQYVMYLLFVRKYTGFSIRNYLKDSFIPIVVAGLFSSCIPFFVVHIMEESFLRLCLVLISNSIMLFIYIYYWGIDKETKNMMVNKVMTIIKQCNLRK